MILRFFLCCAGLLSFVFPVVPVSASNVAQPLKQAMTESPPGETIPVIITFAGQPDLKSLAVATKAHRRSEVPKRLRETAERSQAEVRKLLKGKGKRFQELWIINALALEATPELISQLAERSEIEQLAIDGTIPLPTVEPSQVSIVQWNIDAVRAPEMWAQGFRGQGVVVAVLDSGVDPEHPELEGRWLGGVRGWFDPYRNTSFPYDPDGHGTMVAGIVLGGSAGGSAIGVAPGANWIAAKVFSDDGLAVNSQILRSLQWVLDPDGNPATADAVADIVNNSWGFEQIPGTCDRTFEVAVNNLKAAGIAVVFSAGNAGPAANSGVSPANYAESFAVGAIDPHNTIASFSSRGPSACNGSIYPEIVAPGVAIRTADLAPSGYATVDGTSFSAPHISGVMALLLSADPDLTPAALETSLVRGATDLGPFGPDQAYGYGLANALAAYDALSDGAPVISVREPSLPEDDLLLEFGHLPPGTATEQVVTVRNIGQGFLGISHIGSILPPFAKVSDNCSGRFLSSGESCTFSLRFSPSVLGRFTETLVIDSSDPDQPRLAFHLDGHGNNLPPEPILTAPASGTTVAIPVDLKWLQAPDADGDAITHKLFLSERSDFSDSAPVPIAASQIFLLAGAGGLLFAAGASRRWRSSLLLLASTLLFSCGGGGGSDDGPVLEGFSETAADLQPGTTYYWKIAAEDSRGGTVESEVRSFIAQP